LLAAVSGITGELARWNALRLPQRMASVVAPMILSVGFASLMFCLLATTQNATSQQTTARLQADLVVVPTNAGLPLGVTAEIDRIPGVAATSVMLPADGLPVNAHSGGFVEQDIAMVGLDPTATGAVMRLQFTQGGTTNFHDGTVLLSEQIAKAAHLKVGDQATFYTDDQQPLRLTVAGIFANSLGTGDALVPRSDLVPHINAPLANAVFVDLDHGTDAAEVTRQINALAADGYQLQTVTRSQYIDGVHQSLVNGAWAIYLIIGSAAGLAGLAMVNTMIMSMGQRVRELVLLRLIGATTRQVLLMIGGESLLVLLIGTATGIGIGVISVFGISIGLIGSGSALTVPLGPIAAIVAVAALLSIVAHIVPAWAVLRTDPASQIGMKE
jgi:putative ABC transport system permease protein